MRERKKERRKREKGWECLSNTILSVRLTFLSLFLAPKVTHMISSVSISSLPSLPSSFLPHFFFLVTFFSTKKRAIDTPFFLSLSPHLLLSFQVDFSTLSLFSLPLSLSYFHSLSLSLCPTFIHFHS